MWKKKMYATFWVFGNLPRGENNIILYLYDLSILFHPEVALLQIRLHYLFYIYFIFIFYKKSNEYFF